MSLTPDQYRFLMANLAGFSLALPYKYIPKSYRHEYNYLPGILMVYYCFGRQANTLVLFSIISYIICKFVSHEYVGRVTIFSSLAFLSYAHLSRQIIDYGGYVLDISGPFMIAVQKMTSLGFCLHDGGIKESEKLKQKKNGTKIEDHNNNNDRSTTRNKDDKNNNGNNIVDYDDDESLINSPKSTESSASLVGIVKKTHVIHEEGLDTNEQRKYAVTKMPNFNEFMGYFFHFPSVLCGPMMYYNDYSDFVNTPANKESPPGKRLAVAKKLTISISCAILHLTLNPKFEIEFLRSPAFLVQTPLIMRFCYIFIFTVLSRLKYYVAWHLGEAISNTTGLGFNGYDSNGKPKWNLISNMDLWKFETSSNLRDGIHAWNKTTQRWLRRTAYDRAPKKIAVFVTYTLSALWHGFYPGYYMTFLSGALFTLASRNGRRIFRPMFQRGKILPKVYDVLTFILTRLTIAYAAFPFVILDFHNNFAIYKSLYFSIHILALLGVLLGMIIRRK